MHGVHAQIPGLALRIGPASLPDGHRRGPGLAVVQSLFAVLRPLPQVVEMGYRDRSQPLILSLAELLVLAL